MIKNGVNMMKNKSYISKIKLTLMISLIILVLISCNSNNQNSQENEASSVKSDFDITLGENTEDPHQIENNDQTAEEPYVNVFYYISEFKDRYENYKEKNPDLQDERIVLDVNMYLDYEFYDHIIKADSEDGLLILCNKYSQLSEDFQAIDLIDVPSEYHLEDGKSYKLNEEALENFKEMSKAADKDQIDLTIVSAYRSHDYQQGLYERYKNSQGKDQADTFSARSGHSEHETGLAIDINQISNSFKDTNAYAWLIENAKDYGYILRYKEDQSHRTGYMYEPWHYRFVGVEVASFMETSDLLFDEYYAMYILPSKYE
jgi:D-alanyl-D-alanine carboxypeptidase